MRKFNNKWQEFWWEVFSENGRPSSKRIFGGVMIVCAQVCIFLGLFLGWSTELIRDLVMCDIFSGMGLLGINNVTSIWKGGKIGIGEQAPKLDDENSEDESLE